MYKAEGLFKLCKSYFSNTLNLTYLDSKVDIWVVQYMGGKNFLPVVYSLQKSTPTWSTLVQGSVDAIPRCEETVDGIPNLGKSTLFQPYCRHYSAPHLILLNNFTYLLFHVVGNCSSHFGHEILLLQPK